VNEPSAVEEIDAADELAEDVDHLDEISSCESLLLHRDEQVSIRERHDQAE
jgi:hypothetical protein